MKTGSTFNPMRRLLIWTVSAVVITLLVLIFAGYALLSQQITPDTPVTLTITSGSSLYHVAEQLEKAKVIQHATLLKLLARWKNQGGQIQAGSYRFTQAASAEEILKRLVSGDVEKVSLTIPEGFSLVQIIERINMLGYGEKKTLAALARNPDFIRSLGLPATDSLEGYLFPETYFFVPGVDERALLTILVEQFQKQLSTDLKKAAAKANLSLHQLVTLASIIEKETGLVSEMPLISSVFHNRLKRNIPLQTDPTVIYGIEGFDGNITRKHLRTPSPYNTYLIKGLPPGPIASPGRTALEAAAFPATSDYLYFVARGDGSHQFSKTLREHNAAVRKFQLKRSR